MPFCPECALEFPREVTVCPDCGIWLADRLPGLIGGASAPDADWVRICRLENDQTSEMICGLLDSNNIPSVCVTSSLQQLGTGLGWSAKKAEETPEGQIVMVPREFRDEAEMVLATILGDDFELTDARNG